jgi:hypothetical protein
MSETAITYVYFAGFVVIPFVGMVLYNLGYDVFEINSPNSDGRSLLGAVLLIAFWPMVLAALIVAGAVFAVLAAMFYASKFVANEIQKLFKLN